jgi:hypothetical protein
MPPLVRLYIRHCAIGFGLSAVFVGLLFVFDVAKLWTLVSRSDVGVMAALMLFMGNGIVFAGVQFGITVMRMGEDDDAAAPRPAGAGAGSGPRRRASRARAGIEPCACSGEVTGPPGPWRSNSRGPVYTGGRQVTGPGSGQSQLPRI